MKHRQVVYFLYSFSKVLLGENKNLTMIYLEDYDSDIYKMFQDRAMLLPHQNVSEWLFVFDKLGGLTDNFVILNFV